MPCGILHPMVWGTSGNSLALILKTINLFLPCKLIFWKATKVGSPPNFPKLMSQLWGIPQPQYFVPSILEPHQTYFWKHYIYHKEDTIVGSHNLATKFGFVPDCSCDHSNHGNVCILFFSAFIPWIYHRVLMLDAIIILCFQRCFTGTVSILIAPVPVKQ